MDQFESLYRQHASAVFRFAWGLCGNKSGDLGGVMPPFRLSPEAELRLLDDARSRARNKLMVVGMGIGLSALIILTALGGALMLGVRTFGQG